MTTWITLVMVCCVCCLQLQLQGSTPFPLNTPHGLHIPHCEILPERIMAICCTTRSFLVIPLVKTYPFFCAATGSSPKLLRSVLEEYGYYVSACASGRCARSQGTRSGAGRPSCVSASRCALAATMLIVVLS